MTAKRKPAPELTHVEAARRKEQALARLRELELATKSGELVKLENIQPAWARVVLALRAGMLAIPSKLKLQMPHLSTRDRDIEMIRAAIKEALTVASVTGIPPVIEVTGDDEDEDGSKCGISAK